MVVFLLVVIICIMLFGGTAVLGFAGFVLAFFAAIGFCLWFGIDINTFFTVIVWVLGISVVLGLMLALWDWRLRREIAANNRPKHGSQDDLRRPPATPRHWRH